MVAFSFASINPANLALMLFGLGILAVYYLVKFARQLRLLLVSFGKIAGLTIPINLWWIIPVLNYYVFSSQALNSSVNVNSWSWTHVRASFLNLFWLNGFWGWRPEYDPNFYQYTFPILIILVFVPFLLAASALLFKGEKSRFNAYIMGAILALLFLAKGLHSPPLNGDLLLYQNISLMNIFREPASKFTLLIVPFLALLIGYAVANFANLKVRINKSSFRFTKILVVSLLLMLFVGSVYPLVKNPFETNSYIQIPSYWYQATSWINSQQGDWKVLVTPLDDYYQMPYTWGYYGTDQLVEALFDKPIVSTSSLDSYKINPNTSLDLQELKSSIKGSRSSEFKTMLDLFNIRYIFQRNDVQDIASRDLMSPSEMASFFGAQPYLQLIEKFGSIDIYEYIDYKPSIYTLSPSVLQQSSIEIENKTTLEKEWNFTSKNDVADWQNSTIPNQTEGTSEIKQVGSSFEAEQRNSTSGWISVNSPLLPAQYDSYYSIRVNLAGYNTSDLQIQTTEYAADKSIIMTNASMAEIGGGIFNSPNFQFNFDLKNPQTKFFSIQIYNYFKANETLQSILWLDNVAVTGYTFALNVTGNPNLFANTTQTQTANILKVQKTSPMNTVVTVNATEPFVLVTSQVMDNFWVAYANGEQIKPTSLYLGLQGFSVNKTGQFDVTIEYEPQVWFYYALAISISAVAVLCAICLYIGRERISSLFKNVRKQKGGH